MHGSQIATFRGHNLFNFSLTYFSHRLANMNIIVSANHLIAHVGLVNDVFTFVRGKCLKVPYDWMTGGNPACGGRTKSHA